MEREIGEKYWRGREERKIGERNRREILEKEIGEKYWRGK